jgi:hypothetical protein
MRFDRLQKWRRTLPTRSNWVIDVGIPVNKLSCFQKQSTGPTVVQAENCVVVKNAVPLPSKQGAHSQSTCQQRTDAKLTDMKTTHKPAEANLYQLRG